MIGGGKKAVKKVGSVAKQASGLASAVPGVGQFVGPALSIGGGLLASKFAGGSAGVSAESPSNVGYASPSVSQYESSLAERVLNPKSIASPAYKFSFSKLPSTYADSVYDTGAKTLRREAAGSAEKLKESIGVRRPGLFAKMGTKQEQSLMERLADLRRQADLEAMKQNVQLAKEEQLSQADEDYRARQFESDQERERTANLSDLFGKTSGLYSSAASGAAEVTDRRRTRSADALSKGLSSAGRLLFRR